MRVLVLHSDIPPGAPPDELDTLVQVQAVSAALSRKGHECVSAAFFSDRTALQALLTQEAPDVVFNLVESVCGLGSAASLAPALLAALGVAFTGSRAGAMSASGDKLLAKRLMRAAGIPTAAWAEPPDWQGLEGAVRWIVKSADEDASLGLDDNAVVSSAEAVINRAQQSMDRHGGRWFAEAYVEGREFNVGIVERDGRPFVLPIAEMRFENWAENRPRIVGYGAKWDADNPDFHDTVRAFGWEPEAPDLHNALIRIAQECWNLFGIRGYARVDFRTDESGHPFVLEINANPCLEPEAGFAAAAARGGIAFADLIEAILHAV